MAKKRNSPRTGKPGHPPVPGSAQTSRRAEPASGESDAGIPPKPQPAAPGGGPLGNVTIARVVSLGILLLAIVVIGVLFFQVMASFFVPLFLAALLVVIFRPVFLWVLHRCGGRTHVASIVTTLFILLLVLLPAGLLTGIAIVQGAGFVRHVNAGGFYQSLDRFRSRVGLDFPQAEQFRQLEEHLETLESPVSIALVAAKIDDALELVAYLDDSLAEASLAEDSLEAQTASETLRQELQDLRDRADVLAAARENDDPLRRQDARDEYQTEYRRVQAAHRSWVQAVVGDSVRAQLKLLANPSDADLRALLAGAQQYLQPRVLPMTQVAGRLLFQFLIDAGILVISVYFFFADGPAMIRTLMRLSPLDDAYEERLLLQFDQTSRAVVLATVLSAVAQGIMAAIGFWFFGLPSLILLFLASTFLAFIPFLGPAVIWVPVAVYLGMVEERWFAAIGLSVYGVTVIGTVDNVVRMFVLQGNSHLHPLPALLSVLGGLQVFGPIGILVGPMVVVFLQTLLEIFNSEVQGRREQEPPAETPPPVASPGTV